MTEILLAVSPGELIDQVTIAEIKAERLTGAKQGRAEMRLAYLRETLKVFLKDAGHPGGEFTYRYSCLRAANIVIWESEDQVRDTLEPDDRHTAAMTSHDFNEIRFVHKRAIDELFHSDLLEDKSYK